MVPKDARVASLSQSELLAIMDSHPGRAEEKYLHLFATLVKYFEWNRKPDPEDMAQETLRRAFARFQEGQRITIEDPAGYFFGIARNLIRESWRAPQVEQLEDQEPPRSEPPFHNLTQGEQLVFLRECLGKLPKDEFEMLLAYVEGEGEVWARKAGLPLGAMRMRIHRIRKRLESVAQPKKFRDNLAVLLICV
jgi:DNA-directed RNA polymerase specialized sigma24 family protein